MATIVAQANGNFSNPATWAGGVVPGAGDIAQTGNYAVTIDASITCTLNPTGSGRFDVTTGGITITGDLVMQSSNTGGGLRCQHNSGAVALTGTATGGAGGSSLGAANTGAGTLTVGTATGGAGSFAYGAHNQAAGTLTAGAATGGAGGGAYGAANTGAGTMTVGTATGGAGGSSYGAANTGAGTMTVGTATGGAGVSSYGAANTGAGTMTADLAVGNNWGVGGSGGYAYGVYGSGVAGQTTTAKRIQSGPYGAPAIGGAVLMVADASNSAQFRTAYGGATLTLTDPSASADWPAEADVRAGVEYDLGDKTGTAHIPAAGSVALGVPVDATVGTAVLTAAAVTAGVWDAARSGHAGAGTFGATDEWAGSVDEAAIATAVLDAADSDPISANVTAVKDAALTESAAGRLAAALSKLLDVETPVLTAASVNQSGDAHARLGAPTGASVSADVAALTGYVDTEVAAILAAVDTEVAAIKAKTDNLPASPAAVGSAMALTSAYDAAKTAATQTSVDDLPTNAELAAALAAADDAVLAAIADVPTVAEFEARTLPAADYTVVSDLPSVPSAASIADAVWDEAIAGHAGTGSTGAALAAAGAAGDPWATALPGAYGAGTAGKLLSDIEAVAPDNKPTVAATGEASANVTKQAGVAVAAADANGNVLAKLADGVFHGGWNSYLLLKLIDVRNYDPGGYAVHLQAEDNILGGGQAVFVRGVGLSKAIEIDGAIDADLTVSGLSSGAQQNVRDAMKLAPSAGAPEAGSVDAHLDDILEDTGTTLPALIAGIEGGGDPWATVLPGAYGAGTAGALLSGIDSSVDEAAIADAVLSAMDAAPPAVNVTYWKGGVAPAMTGDAFARLGAPAGASVSVDIAAIPTAAEIDTQLSGTHGAGAWGASSGASSVTYTATVDGAPTAGVYCRMTTDAAGLVNIAAGTTNALGQVTFLHDLPSGTTVYLWRSLAGVEFANPDIEVIP